MWTAASSSTSSSNLRVTTRSSVQLYTGTLLCVLGTLLTIEITVRNCISDSTQELSTDPSVLLNQLENVRIHGREIGNQMIAHNVALFASHPAPLSVRTAYVGTSRTKVLRPTWLGIRDAINSSGNSYNEISYGLLLQAEIARRQFPNLKRVYFESSLLLRRPAKLLVENDHKKYLPLLDDIVDIRRKLPEGSDFEEQLRAAKYPIEKSPFRLDILNLRQNIRITYLLLGEGSEKTPLGGLPVTADDLFKELNPDGQRKRKPANPVGRSEQKQAITGDNPKVQRMRDIQGNAPWDGLFDLIALWGVKHNIEIVFFQPPVRSDLYQFQTQMGLTQHTADILRVSKQYRVPFIDLNTTELGYMFDWSIFSDEDHLETCQGVILLQSGIDAGMQLFEQSGEIDPNALRHKTDALRLMRSQLCT